MPIWRNLLLAGAVFTACGCAFAPSHPCQEAGEPARDVPFKGDKRCSQTRTPNGKYVNQGPYQEWYPNGKLALEGGYKMGKKDGRWIEYDPNGRKVSQRFYEDGVDVPEKVVK